MRIPLRPLLVAFVVGAAVMAVELLTPRLVARHLGTSVTVWSAVFAVFLGGLALGNFAGGALADRFEARRLASILSVASAAALLCAPALDRFAEGAFRGLPLLPRALLSIAVAYFPATILFGSAPPALAKWTLSTAQAPGRALGAVAAAGAVGSVVGTFATGFVLIPGMGTSVAMRAIAGIVAAAGVVPWLGRRGPVQVRVGAALGPPVCRPVPREPTQREGPSGPPLQRAVKAPGAEGNPPLSRGAIAALAVIAGAALLVVEVLAGRTALLFVGNDIYTWTSVVGVVLLGLAIGNAVGGRLADAMPARRALGLAFLAASVLTALTLWTPRVLGWSKESLGGPLPFRIAFGVLIAWGPAAVALGSIGPILARAALSAAGGEGRSIGRIYALGTAGAIVGGLATSPWLVPALGTSATVCAAALALALASRWAGRRTEGPWIAGLVIVALAATLPFSPARAVGLALAVREDVDGAYVRESRYYRIRVDDAWPPGEVRVEGRRIRRMRLDALVHGYVDLDDPTWTGYRYEGVYASVTERAAPVGRPPRALLLGGGPYAFPRFLMAKYPGSTVVVAEIDPAVTEAAIEALALPHPEAIQIVHEDARTFVRDLPADAPPYDLVYGDAFNDLSVPFHLTTVEFVRSLKARMTKDGAYIVNVIDVFDSGRFVGAMVATLAQVFAHVELTSLDRWRGSQENFILVASDRKIDLAGLSLESPSDPTGPRLAIETYSPEEVASLLSGGRGIVLTDDYAPAENLLAPLLR